LSGGEESIGKRVSAERCVCISGRGYLWAGQHQEKRKEKERKGTRPGWPVLDRGHKCGKAPVTSRPAPLDVTDRWRRPLVSGRWWAPSPDN
jgi:hypothetical protein